MKFRYIGEEYTEFFGFKWMHGTEHEVTDEHAVKKLANSVLFEKIEGKPGKPGKAKKPEQAPEVEPEAEAAE